MTEILESYRQAVAAAIDHNHKRGLPVFQCEDGYIIALYPNNRKVRLEKAKSMTEYYRALAKL